MLKIILSLSTFVAYYIQDFVDVPASISIPAHAIIISLCAFYFIKDRITQVIMAIALVLSWATAPYYSEIRLLSLAAFAAPAVATMIWLGFTNKPNFFGAVGTLSLLQGGICGFILNKHITFNYGLERPIIFTVLWTTIFIVSCYLLLTSSTHDFKRVLNPSFKSTLKYLMPIPLMILGTLVLGTWQYFLINVLFPFSLIFSITCILTLCGQDKFFRPICIASGMFLFLFFNQFLFSYSMLGSPIWWSLTLLLPCLGCGLVMLSESTEN
ncbi:MAG: hypothetical protein ACNI27_13050 [Desulfovibrio sp.]